MHEEKRADGDNEDILEIWGEVWSDGTPGTEGGIRLYLKVQWCTGLVKRQIPVV